MAEKPKPLDAGKYRALQARWGDMKWYVKASGIKALEEAGFNSEYDSTAKKNKLKAEATVSYELHKALAPNVDIAAEIWTWRRKMKKKNVLYVGATALAGYRKYQLVGMDVSEVEVQSGEIIHCVIELTFKAIRKSFNIKKYKRARKKYTKASRQAKKKQAAKIK